MAKNTKPTMKHTTVSPVQPAGYVEKTRREFGEFWNPEPGDSLEGTIAGTVTIQDKPRIELLDKNSKLWTLPDHYDLNEKLRDVSVGTRVFIQYRGKTPVEGVPGGFMAVYFVGVKA